eukprot:1792230-Pyramimonas_sp.AAC.1
MRADWAPVWAPDDGERRPADAVAAAAPARQDGPSGFDDSALADAWSALAAEAGIPPVSERPWDPHRREPPEDIW